MDKYSLFTKLILIVVLLMIIAVVIAYVLQRGTVSSPGGMQTTLPAEKSTVAGKSCGVTKTNTGYTFSWLHVSRGYVLDDKGCIVDLRGLNWAQLEFGNAVGGGLETRISAEGIAWYSQTLHTNVWRFPINATWWNEDVDVPLAAMPYRDWIQQIVKWAEDNGNYIILTKGPQFHFPPCGKYVKFCPPQNAGNGQHAQTTIQEQTTGQYIDPAVQMWTSIARLYANDPAILYDSWNEMHNISAQTWHDNTNMLIETIRAQNPRSLIFLGGPDFKGNINPLVQGIVPDFTQPNLVYDFHVYDGYQGEYQGRMCGEPMSYIWKNWPANADQQVEFSQKQGKAVAFSEWGGCNDLDPYHQAITSYARDHHICLVYYDQANLATFANGTYTLSANGQKVQSAYTTL